MKHNLSLWPWGRCKAIKEPNSSGYWGRCELKTKHTGDHFLERGMEHLYWSTQWTSIQDNQCHCTAHDVTDNSLHAIDCPFYND